MKKIDGRRLTMSSDNSDLQNIPLYDQLFLYHLNAMKQAAASVGERQVRNNGQLTEMRFSHKGLQAEFRLLPVCRLCGHGQ